MTNILTYFLIGFLAFESLSSVLKMRRENKSKKEVKQAVEEYLKATLEKDKFLMEFFKVSFDGLNKGLKDIGTFLLTDDVMGGVDLFGTKIPMNPAIRIYSLLLRKMGTFEQKLYSVPGHTLEEARQLAVAHLGAGWELTDSSFLDVSVPREPVELKVETMEKAEEKKGVVDFVSSVKYIIANFTTKKSEKDLLENIITRINKKYDRNSTKKNT